MNPALRALLALFALVNIWIGAAIIIAGIRAALEGEPDRIVRAADVLSRLAG